MPPSRGGHGLPFLYELLGTSNVDATTFWWNFSNKWLSQDGKDFVMIFTGVRSNDSWNTVRGSFVLADFTPPDPPTGLRFYPP